MRVAVLVDAAFFLTRYKIIFAGARQQTGQEVAEALHRIACSHTRYDSVGESRKPIDLYRVFVYDCPPFLGKLQNPISKATIDFSKSDLAKFRRAFLDRLPQLRKVALRLGHLSEIKNWTIKPRVMSDLLKGHRSFESLTAEDVALDVKQKGVDMRIGVDVASLAYKRQVDRIVLIAGDADFVPAAKLARREGIDFVLDSMHAHINSSLYEHIDGLVSMAPTDHPRPLGNAGQPQKGYTLNYGAATWPVEQSVRQTFGQPSLFDAVRRRSLNGGQPEEKRAGDAGDQADAPSD